MATVDESSLVLDGIFFKVPSLSILQGAYLSVLPGSITALFGRNGSGKSTLLKVAAAQLNPSSGLVIIDGERFHHRAHRRRFNNVAYLPQDSMLPGELKVKTLIKIFPKADLLKNDALINSKLDQHVHSLSGGERRYVELSLLLSLGRKYALLDEPFTGIEPLMIDHITDLIVKTSKEGIGFLITDHYYQYMLDIATDAYLMLNKQCKHLNGKGSLAVQLKSLGYMPENKGATH